MNDLLEYPKGYLENLQWRARLWHKCASNEQFRESIKTLFHKDILFAFNGFFFTLDVRKRPKHHQPFCTWAYQDDYLRQLCHTIDGGYDLLTEKSRDMGVSWLVISTFVWYWLNPAGGCDFLLGSRIEDYVDKRGDMRTLMEKARYLIYKLPEWLLPKGYNREKHDNYMRLYNPESGSTITGESNNANFSTGGRYTAILLDEFAKWDTTDTSAWTAAGDATPSRLPVSTPFGASGQYYQLATDGKTPKVTLHWSLHPEKAHGAYCEIPKQEAISDIHLIRSPWFDKQCRRRTPTEIAQELQIDYIGAGRPVFDGKAGKNLVAYFNRYRQDPPPVKYYDLESEAIVPALIYDNQDTTLFVYEDCRPDGHYIISADVAEGLEKNDFSAIIVFNGISQNIAAVHHARTNEVKIADYLKKIQALYTPEGARVPPVVAVETTGPGLATFDRCEMLFMENLFMMPRYDATKQGTTYRKGWRTDMNSRQAIVASVREFLEIAPGELNYMPIVRECMTFVRNRQGKPEAKSGSYDDLVMCFGINLEVLQHCPPMRVVKKAEGPVELNDLFRLDSSDEIGNDFQEKPLSERCLDHCMEKRRRQHELEEGLTW